MRAEFITAIGSDGRALLGVTRDEEGED